MSVQCKQWSAGGRGWGHCALKLYGGRPSFGTCLACKSYDGPPRDAAKLLPNRTPRDVETKAERGRKFWIALHAWSRSVDPANAAETIRTIEKSLPCGTAKVQWKALREKHPLPTTREGLIAWASDRHDDVNRFLGKVTEAQKPD